MHHRRKRLSGPCFHLGPLGHLVAIDKVSAKKFRYSDLLTVEQVALSMATVVPEDPCRFDGGWRRSCRAYGRGILE
jgi:hypothetical protein